MNKAIFVGLFFTVTISVVFSADYDEILARYKLWPMASAAYGDDPSLCVKDNFANSEFKRKYTVQCDMIKNDTCSGFSAVSHSDKAIILTFRGTEAFLQLVNEGIDMLLVPPEAVFRNAGVNKYFLDGFNDIWNGGMKDDFLTLKNANPSYELWVTGHSFGGAMASIAAATISNSGYMPADKIKLVTFGQPRVGNSSYVDAADKLIPYSFRVVHAHDIVPHLPPKGMLGYFHHKSEVWYNNNMAVGLAYTVCNADEGEGCSDSNLDLSIDDHMDYFNISGAFAENGCPGYNPYH